MISSNEFLRLIEDNRKIIHKVCNMYCSNQTDREDLYQEILLNAWKGIAHFRGDARFSTWLYRVALNTAITGLKKQQKTPATGQWSDDIHELPADIEKEDSIKAMHYAIEQLSNIEKALVMLFFDNYSYQQIADILGISANNVGVRMNRIKTKLKAITTKFN